MRNIELGEKLRSHRGELTALMESELGAEKLEALEKVIYPVDLSYDDVIEDIVDSDRYDNSDNYSYNGTTDDFIKAFKLVLTDDDIEFIKEFIHDEFENLPFYNGEITDEFLYLIFKDHYYDDEFSKELESIEDLASMLIADKYYKYFKLDFIKEFLGE